MMSGNLSSLLRMSLVCIVALTGHVAATPSARQYDRLVRAGDAALADDARDRAVMYYRRAVIHIGNNVSGVVERLALVAWMSGSCDEMHRALTEWNESTAHPGDIERRVRSKLIDLHFSSTQGRYPEVVRLATELIDIYRSDSAMFVKEHELAPLSYLAFALFATGSHEKAALAHVQAMDADHLKGTRDPLQEAILGAGDAFRAASNGDGKQALILFRGAIRAFDEQISPEHPALVPILSAYSEALEGAGRVKDSKKINRRAVRLAKSATRCEKRKNTFRAPQ